MGGLSGVAWRECDVAGCGIGQPALVASDGGGISFARRDCCKKISPGGEQRT